MSIHPNPTLPSSDPTILWNLSGFDAASFQAAATAVGLDADVVAAALAQLRAGTVIGLSVSGKISSGKDTVAPKVLDQLGYSPAEHLFFAKALKAEFNDMLAIMRAASSDAPREITARAINEEMGIPVAQAAEFVTHLFDHARENLALDAYSRTPQIRWGLQYLGTDVRRAQDTDYWVKRALVPAITALAEGRSVFFTDCRFPNEVEGSSRVGFMTARLEITPEVQRARLEERDGQFDPAAFAHASETALDGYGEFDLIVNNDHQLDDTVAAVARALLEHGRAITAS